MAPPAHHPVPHRSTVRGAVAGVVVLTSLAAWSPLATAPPPSLRTPDGLLDLGVADVVLQRRPNACALAVLAMLLRPSDGRADEERLVALAGASLADDGATLADVARIASEAGVPGRWLRASVRDLPALPLPFAAELEAHVAGRSGHLVLVRDVSADGVLVADPARGLVAWPRRAFRDAWSGRVFVPDASAPIDRGLAHAGPPARTS